MQKIKLWSVESSGSTRKATAVADIDATETEQQLEDLLVNSALLHDSTAARVGVLFQLLVQDTTAQDFGLPSSAIRLRM